MKNIREAYQTFWSQFVDNSHTPPRPIPAFAAGTVVFRDATGKPISSPQFPYVTFEIVRTPFAESTISSASIWDSPPLQVQNIYARIDDVLEQAAKAIPEEGVAIRTGDSGGIIIYRSTPFIDYMDEPSNTAIARGIIRIIIKNYTT